MLLDMLLNRTSLNLHNVIIYILSALAVIFLTMPVHEYAHALAGTKLGDPTPKYTGRLSLNPFHHIDYFGALCIILVGFGWAKPVQINPRNFNNPKKDMAIVAFAGPLANLITAFVSLFLANVFLLLFYKASLAFLWYIVLFFSYIAQINVGLAIFNLIPVPPLDGSKLLAAFLPDRIYYRLMQYERYLYFLLILLIVTGALSYPLSLISYHVYNGLDTIAGFFFRIFY